MKTLVKITYDQKQLFFVGKTWLVFIACWFLGIAIASINDEGLAHLTDQSFWFKIFVSGVPASLMLLLPLSFSPFIKPLSQSRKNLFVHSGLIVLIGGLIFAIIIYSLINNSVYPYEIRDELETVKLMTALCFSVHIMIFLSKAIIMKDAKS